MRAHPSPGLRARFAADGDAFHLLSISYEQRTWAVSFCLHYLMKSSQNFNWVGMLISFSRCPQMLSAFYRWENRVSLWVASSLSKRWLDNQLCHYKARGEDLGSTSGKEPACQCRSQERYRFDPWVGKIPWRRAWQPNPIFLENPRDRGAWWATVHRVTKSWTPLKMHSVYTFFHA